MNEREKYSKLLELSSIGELTTGTYPTFKELDILQFRQSERRGEMGEKPEYGIYVGYSVIIAFVLVGLIGLALFISGFLVKSHLKIALWAIGAILSILFLWPGIGMSFTNMLASRQEKIHFDFVKQFHKVQILDCGCGTGRHAIPLAKQMTDGSSLTGIDIYDTKSISVNSVERVQRNAEIEGVADRTKFIVGSVTDIPFRSDMFDIVTCMGVVHELRSGKRRAKAFEEIYRVLRSSGIFYMRELNRLSNMLTMGILALLALRSSSYWRKELEKHNFHIYDTYREANSTTVFLARKMAKHVV